MSIFTNKCSKGKYLIILSIYFCSGLLIDLKGQQTYTFTTAGNTGSVGPSQIMINANYAFTSLSGAVTISAGIQSWTVPASGLYLIDTYGAAGGDAPDNFKLGGLGARIQGQFNLTLGDVVQVLVGQKGSSCSGCGAGGGGTYLLRNGTLLIAAGGGGGASYDNHGVAGSNLTMGTMCSQNIISGGVNGAGGSACINTVSPAGDAGGGGGYLIGPIGNGMTVPTSAGGGLSYMNGGTGGIAMFMGACPGGFGGGGAVRPSSCGGGGGGGYSGGAGGQQVNHCAIAPRAGGGGGGSFNSGANQINTSGFQQGDGRVVLTYLCGSISLNSTSNPICPGNSTTLSTNAVSNYSWNTGSTSSSIIVSPTVTTTYSVVGQSTLNCTGLALLTLSVTQLSLTISPSSPIICLGNAITFTASNSGGTGIYNYTWTAGPQTNTYTTLQNSAGNYVYTVNSSDANNCLSTQTIAVDFVPNPTLSVSNISICPLESGTLNVSGASSYTWLPGNITGSSYTQSPVGSSQYTVVGSQQSCTSVATASIIVKASPNPIINSNSPVCENTNLVFSVTSGTAALWAGLQSYSSSNQSNTLAIANPSQSGIYSVTVTAANSCTASTSASLTVNPLPSLSISPNNASICANTTTVALTTNGTATLFNWSPTLGLSSATAAIVNAGPVTTQVYNLIGALNACTLSASATVNVVAPPMLALSLSSNSLCAQAFNGSPNTITLTSSGANTYTLSTPNQFNNSNPGGPASQVSLSPPYLNTGPTTATLLGSNGVCTLSLTANFTVVPNPTIALNSFTPIICAGETFTYNASGANTFTWSSITPGSTLYSTGNIAVANPSINSVFTVFGSSLFCNSALQTTSLTVTPLPVFSIQPNPAIICLGTSINLDALGNASTYSWMPSTGLNQTQGPNVSSNPLSQQNYTIIGTTNNCSNTALVTVSVSSCSQIDENFGSKLLHVFPNPFDRELLIQGHSTELSVEIMDGFGKLILRRQISSLEGLEVIKTEDLSTGIYFLQIFSPGEKVQTLKIIKN